MQRTTGLINECKKMCERMGWNYSIQHGTYTTKIIHPRGQIKFQTCSFSKKTFMAYNMIKRDIKDNPKAKEIIESRHQKNNYSQNDVLTSFQHERCLNIDIKSAYATTMLIHGLIRKETYDFICSLPKQERLVCVGMLARGYTRFDYEGKECVNVETYREPTAQIFFFLIEEIEYVMRDCKWYLGNDYIFHWVDGVFFKPTTSKKKIEEIENVFTELGYKFKFEDVRNFTYNKKDTKIVVTMVKNGEHKRYEFSIDETHKDIQRKLYRQIQTTTHQLHN